MWEQLSSGCPTAVCQGARLPLACAESMFSKNFGSKYGIFFMDLILKCKCVFLLHVYYMTVNEWINTSLWEKNTLQQESQ